jgi:hypothetical protein
MLTPAKQDKLLSSLKDYRKKFLDGRIVELDESGTRLMINSFLSDVLGFKPIEEIRTEYMIKGTYADYVLQVDSKRYFLVEVKALSFDLTDKHLRQSINYAANEGIDYVLLTNGKIFQFYKVLFGKPIDTRMIFSADISDLSAMRATADYIQHLHRDSVVKYNFVPLWSKCEATDPNNIAGILCSQPVIDVVAKLVRQKFGEKCDDDVILAAVQRIITDKMDMACVKPFKAPRAKPVKKESAVFKVVPATIAKLAVQPVIPDEGVN